MRFQTRAGAAAAALCAVGAMASPAAADVFNGRIGFTSFRVDHDPGPGERREGDIFSMHPDGTGVRQLTSDPAYDAQSDFSPDGTAIVYRIRKPDSPINFEVARMPAGGGERTVLTSSPPAQASSQPSWYPDMSAIIYRVSGGGAPSDIWRIGAGGESPSRLFALERDQWYPTWSPDGGRVLFATTMAPGDRDRGIFSIRADGSGLTSLFDVPGVFDSAPAWSPDGRRIAFESDADPVGVNPEHDREIFVMNDDGTGAAQLTRNVLHDEGPTWSADGTMLAYTSGPDNLLGDINVMTAGGVHLRTLTSYEGRDESPDWQSIPAPDTDRRCGDLPADAIADVRAAGRSLHCRQALRVAERWAGGRTPRRYAAEVSDYGGTTRVVLTKARRHEDKLVAFLVRH